MSELFELLVRGVAYVVVFLAVVGLAACVWWGVHLVCGAVAQALGRAERCAAVEARRGGDSHDGHPAHPFNPWSRRREAACRTLDHLGYTWEGGELWKPPLGPLPPRFTNDARRGTVAPIDKES